ncbi:aspartate aminotransferase family protein [Pyrolobus fumarii]
MVLDRVELVRFYQVKPIRIVRGEGQYVWDDRGNRYLDYHTGYGTAFLGHRNPFVMRRLREQLEKIMTVSLTFENDTREEALRALRRVLPPYFTHVFFQNSGAEAVELALKAAVKATKGRSTFVALVHSFHGRTLGALSMTHGVKYRKAFEPVLLKPRWVKPNDIEGLEKAIDDSVAAVILEPVIGEGGIIPLDPEFLKAARELTREHGALLIVDEIQSGFGRTGLPWAHMEAGIEPDVMTAGKAIGGGFPVSLVAFQKWVAESFETGEHGSTYAGNPLACAAVLGAVEAFEADRVPEQAKSKGEEALRYARERLEGLKAVRDIRGKGLMFGVELRFPPGKVLDCLLEKRVLALRAGATVVRFLPPYLTTVDELRSAIDALAECIKNTYG